METLETWTRAICREPFNTQLKLVFCDWLDENDHQHRAEVTRQQVNSPMSIAIWASKVFQIKFYGAEMPVKDATVFREHDGFVSSVALTLTDFMTHAEYLFTHFPITKIIISDKQCSQFFKPFCWFKSISIQGIHSINDVIYDKLKKYHKISLSIFKIYKTEELARLDLSQACVNYGRELVGLPELTFESEA